MRKHLLASAALIVGAGFALPAAADIVVTGTVTYDKQVTETERLTKTKTVNLNVTLTANTAFAAEANAVINQRIGNTPTGEGQSNLAIYNGDGLACHVCLNTLGTADFNAVVTGSINGNFGVTQYNQDVGYASNQNNTLSAAVAHLTFFVEANNSAAQYNINNALSETGRLVDETGRVALIRQSLMTGSVNANTGLVEVNQNSGNFNNQLNSAVIALGFLVNSRTNPNNAAVALAESDLGQWNVGQATLEFRTARVAGISDSVHNNTGVVMGNQAAGQMANQANMLSVSAGVNWSAGNAGMQAFVSTLPPNF